MLHVPSFSSFPSSSLGTLSLKLPLPEERSTNKQELDRQGFPSWSLGTSHFAVYSNLPEADYHSNSQKPLLFHPNFHPPVLLLVFRCVVRGNGCFLAKADHLIDIQPLLSKLSSDNFRPVLG